MGAKHSPFVITLIILFSTKSIICNDANSIEIRSINVDRSHSNTHHFATTILNSYLNSLGTSLSELHSKLLTSNKNLEEIIDVINTSIHEDLIRIDGDSIKFEYQAVINTINRIIETVLRQKFINNPLLVVTVENSIKQHIQQHSIKIKELLNRISIRTDDLQKYVGYIHSLHRNKREILQTNRIFDGFMNILSELAIKLIRSQIGYLLRPLQTNIINRLSSLSDYIITFYTPAAPDTELQIIVISSKNIVIRRSAEVISILKTMINELFDNFLEKQIVNNNTGINKSEIQTGIGSNFNFIINSIKDFIKRILKRIGTFFQTIVNYIPCLNC